MAMRVGELARRTGVGVSTLRAWEARHRFLEPARSPTGQRLYTEADVDRVEAVLRLVAEGLTLASSIARIASAGTGALPSGEAVKMLYAQILEAADQGIWVSKDGRTRYANQHMAAMLGYTVEELVNIPVLSFFTEESLHAVKRNRALVRAGKSLRVTTVLRRADGSTFPAEIKATPLLDAAGRYEGAVAVVDDLTARADTEFKAYLRTTLLDSASEALMATSIDGRIVYANAAAERLFGWRVAELLGQPGDLFVPPQAATKGNSILGAIIDGRRYSGTIQLQRRDGTQLLAHVNVEPVRDDSGAVVGLIASIRDHAERMRIDRERRTRRLQSETLALLGAGALRRTDDCRSTAMELVTEVVEATRRLLRANHASMLDIASGSGELEVRAASPRLSERVVVPAGSRSFAGYIAFAGKVVIVDNTEHDARFDTCGSPGRLPACSAIGAPIFGADGIVGVLLAESTAADSFGHDDAHFIQGMANVIGAALIRTPT